MLKKGSSGGGSGGAVFAEAKIDAEGEVYGARAGTAFAEKDGDAGVAAAATTAAAVPALTDDAGESDERKGTGVEADDGLETTNV
ncbi:MAG: hypothetical protein QWI73_05240 [Alphaproteobacteria bacterium]|nr:hypothetical protein [Alphaproteobacteria bacterium]